MAKYSVNSNSSERSTTERSKGGFCEKCGEETSYLHSATIAGASLEVCAECKPEESSDSKNTSNGDKKSTKDLVNENTRTAGVDADPDSSWAEQGLNYEGEDKVPYLVPNYGSIVQEKREEKGWSLEKLSEESDVGTGVIQIIEQNQASSESIKESLIKSIEDTLEVTIREE